MGMDNRSIGVIFLGEKRNVLHLSGRFWVSSVGCKGYESEDRSLPPCRANAWSYTSAL